MGRIKLALRRVEWSGSGVTTVAVRLRNCLKILSRLNGRVNETRGFAPIH